ncbi:MAG: hypothetical protein OEW15_04000 [Nitrospirota bacterium]|nr:hypothetical protein [Nitrospirota bacterium]
MKPPLFVIEGFDISAYASLEKLENHLEPFFVKEVNYKAYDSEGRLLTLSVKVERKPFFFGLFKAERKCVVMQSVELEPKYQKDLHDALVNNLAYTTEENKSTYQEMSLSKLIDIFVKINGLT